MGGKCGTHEQKKKAYWAVLFVDERVILKLILKKWGWREETLLMWPRMGTSGGIL